MRSHAGVSIQPSLLVSALVHIVGGPARVEVAGVRSAPRDPALHLYALPACILELLLLTELHPIQSGAPRHHPSRIGVLPAPLAETRLLGQEAGLNEPPLAFSVDVPLAHAAGLPNSW